jgi:phosphoribosylformylglycinamidine cyclo-ligase
VIGPLLDRGWIKGMAHSTGGGITENLPRVLPEGRGFRLDRASWTVPPIFQWLQKGGGLEDAEMFRAFNMGVGLIAVCSSADADALLSSLAPSAWRLGSVT